MYKALDEFIALGPRASLNWPDWEVFYRGLDQIVKVRAFSISDMTSYLSVTVGIENLPEGHPYLKVIERCLDRAETIRAYVEATSQIATR